MMAAWLTRVPCRIYTIHGLPFMAKTGLLRHLLIATERTSCGLATSVLAVSVSMRAVALEQKLCSRHKIDVLAAGTTNGIDTRVAFALPTKDERRRARAALGFSSEACVIGFVGRIVKDKGICELAEAWSLIASEFPQARLLLVGPEESVDAPPRSTIERLRSDPRVSMLGYVADPRAMYCAIDIVALPSYREGFPIVPLEAAAMGLPVVATAIPGCTDAVMDGHTGTLVAVRDSQALVEALRTYLATPALRLAHGQHGLERVRSQFSQEVLWGELARHYRRGIGPLA